ncbi:MAG: hypothetical protein J6X30_00335 [Clostridia bacterium]|nr:hypothetical protein [Clostridia bacterium]
MSKQRETTEYRVRYATDRNAALQPEFIPQPERKRAPARRPQPRQQQKALRKAEVARCAALVMLVCCVAAMGFFVVSRNANIYRNAQEIRALAKRQQELQVLVNTAEKDYSVGSELNAYFDIAQNQLNMSYPAESDIVTVVSASAAAEEADEAVMEGVNVYDTILDWFSSLKEGIRSWMEK